MAKEKQMIVIKKITVSGGGHHGGAWKVAFADFMTGMMAFFLCMWLISQNDETKKAISDYFSTPSVIEYSFQNFGVELTLEKLFLDLLNEPIKAVQEFLQPMDTTPNIFDFGSKKIITAYIADQLGEIAKNVEINQDEISFDIPDYVLFHAGSADPTADFIPVMDKVRKITTGLENANVMVYSRIFNQAVDDKSPRTAQRVANQRLDLVSAKIESSLEHSSTRVMGAVQNQDYKQPLVEGQKPVGFVHIKIKLRTAEAQLSTPEGKGATGKLEPPISNPIEEADLYESLNQELRIQPNRTTK